MVRKSVKYNSFNIYCLDLNLPLLLHWQQELKLEKLNLYSNQQDIMPSWAGTAVPLYVRMYHTAV
jgi:hypothetical protein